MADKKLNLKETFELYTSLFKEYIAKNTKTYTHPNSGVTAGSYRNVTVDAQGHVTAGNNATTTISQGGTNATTAKGAEYNIIGGITEAEGAISDSTPIVGKYSTPSTTAGVLHWRKASVIWDYIKGKISSVLGLTATQYNGNANTATNLAHWSTVSPGTTLNRWCKIASVTLANAYSEYHAIIVATEHEVHGGCVIFDWSCCSSSSATTIENNGIQYIAGAGDLLKSYKDTFFTQAIIEESSITFNLWCQPLRSYATFDFTVINESKNNLGNILSKYNKPAYVTDELTGIVNKPEDVEFYGTASKAGALSNTTAVGSATQPVYFNASGVPVATTYTLGKSVPSDAVFTDTKYTHPSYTAKTSGLYKVTVDATGHVSATAAVAKSDITALGIPAQDTTYSAATTSTNGLMTSDMVTKLNGIATGANKTTVDTSISTTSTNPVQNKVVKTELDKKLDKSGGTMTGALVAQANTNYTTAQVRNVTMSTKSASGGSNGQIHYQYE